MENEIRENSGTPYLVTVVLLGILAILYFLVEEFYFLIPVGIILLASCIRLQLKITRSHLHYSVFPFVHRKLALEDISSYDIKELNALSDFMGWGIRYSPRLGWGYVFFTKDALYITKTNGKKLVLSIKNKEKIAAFLETALTQ